MKPVYASGVVIIISLLAACTSPGSLPQAPQEQPPAGCPLSTDASPAQWAAARAACTGQLSQDLLPDAHHRRDLDVLFLIDNSPSMTPKQRGLAENIPRFIQAIDRSGADYHVGIATSDVGSYTAPDVPWTVSVGSCNTFEGDDGALQRVACGTRTSISAEARAACDLLCPDDRFVPQDGTGFISKIDGVTNVPGDTTTLPGMDIGPQRAFQCMALLGDSGCGIEGQFEGMKRALDGHNPQNAGFLRPGSLLAVILITDEDDCSVSPAGRVENNPVTTDCPTPDKNAPFSCFNPDYRCLARDVVCDEPTNTLGVKHHCVERPSSYLQPVGSYVSFLRSLRPSRLLLSGIWSPSIDRGGQFVVVPQVGTKTDQFNRGLGADAACANAMDPTVAGRPQVRLSKLASRVPGSIEISVCDLGDYPRALDLMATTMTRRLQTDCTAAVPMVAAGRPVCLVGEVDVDRQDALPENPYPACSDRCCQAWAEAEVPTAEDPGISAACQKEAGAACYCAVPSQKDACTGGAVAGVWRSPGTEVPAGKTVSFTCCTAPPLG